MPDDTTTDNNTSENTTSESSTSTSTNSTSETTTTTSTSYGAYSMGYGASGYTLTSEETASSSSSSGSGDSSATFNGLMQEGDFITSLRQIVMTVIPYGTVLAKDSGGQHYLVKGGSYKNGTTSAGKPLPNTAIECKGLVDGDNINVGCIMPKKIVTEYCTKFYSDVPNLDTNLEKIAAAGLLYASVKVQTASSTSYHHDIMVVAFDNNSSTTTIGINAGVFLGSDNTAVITKGVKGNSSVYIGRRTRYNICF